MGAWVCEEGIFLSTLSARGPSPREGFPVSRWEPAL